MNLLMFHFLTIESERISVRTRTTESLTRTAQFKKNQSELLCIMFEGTAKQAVLVSADLDSVVIASTASRITMLVISCTVLPVYLLPYQFLI